MTGIHRYDSLIKFYSEQMALDWELIRAQCSLSISGSTLSQSGDPKLLQTRYSKSLKRRIRKFYSLFGIGLKEHDGTISFTDPENYICGLCIVMSDYLTTLSNVELSLMAHYCGLDEVVRQVKDGFSYVSILNNAPLSAIDYVVAVMSIYLSGSSVDEKNKAWESLGRGTPIGGYLLRNDGINKRPRLHIAS